MSERQGWNFFIVNAKKTNRMKNDQKNLKSIKGAGKDLPAKPLAPGSLYVVFLNKPLIDLWAITDLYRNDYYDAALSARTNSYLKSNSAMYSDDSIPGILSQEDEMMLYNEGFFDKH